MPKKVEYLPAAPAALGSPHHRDESAHGEPPPVALTVAEAAGLLRLDPRTVREMVRSGELEGNQRGHAIRVSRSSVLDWVRGKRRVPRSKR